MAELKLQNRVSIIGDVTDVEIKKILNDDNETLKALAGDLVVSTGDGESMKLGFYQSPKWKSGNDNPNFKRYQNWANDLESETGQLTNTKIKMTSSIDSNIFVAGGTGELVATTQVGAGFFDRDTPSKDTPNMAEFALEVILKPGCVRPEIKDEIETGRGLVFGEIANYKGVVYPVYLAIENQDGINHIKTIADSNDVSILNVWGKVVSSREVVREEVAAAFGAPRVVETVNTRRENLITGAAIEAKDISQETKDAIVAGRQAFEVAKTTAIEKNNAKGVKQPTATAPAGGATNTSSAKADFKF